MKVITLLCCLFPYFSNCQIRDTVPLKGANKVTVKNNRSVRQNFFLLQSSFLDKGYTVIINYKDLTVQTKDSLIENGTASYTLSGFAKGDSVVLTGSYKVMVVTSIMGEEKVYNYDIANSGFQGGLSRKMFAALENIAKGINGIIFYTKEKKKKRGFIL